MGEKIEFCRGGGCTAKLGTGDFGAGAVTASEGKTG